MLQSLLEEFLGFYTTQWQHSCLLSSDLLSYTHFCPCVTASIVQKWICLQFYCPNTHSEVLVMPVGLK